LTVTLWKTAPESKIGFLQDASLRKRHPTTGKVLRHSMPSARSKARICDIVDEWRTARRQGENDRDIFLEEWNDILRSYHTSIKNKVAPLTVKSHLTVVKSFFSFRDIPLKVELPRRACVIYHNRDLNRDDIRQIITHASARDRVIWLIMAESGIRAENAANLEYWQTTDDFEANKCPMRILLPSSTLKDHVGDRWTFIGEDGLRKLQEYLKPRMPLTNEDYVFVYERIGRVTGDQFSSASLSVKFNRVVQKLGLDKPREGKPKGVRLHGLRKYFRNNMKADGALREFWMGHSLGVDAHYITRDPEVHRQEYAKGYKFLRIFEPSLETLGDIADQLRKKDDEIKALKETMAKLQPLIDLVNSYPTLEQMKAELGLTKEYDKSDKLHSAKTMPEELAEIQMDEAKREALARAPNVINREWRVFTHTRFFFSW